MQKYKFVLSIQLFYAHNKLNKISLRYAIMLLHLKLKYSQSLLKLSRWYLIFIPSFINPSILRGVGGLLSWMMLTLLKLLNYLRKRDTSIKSTGNLMSDMKKLTWIWMAAMSQGLRGQTFTTLMQQVCADICRVSS